MNPETNKFEPLSELHGPDDESPVTLLRPNGTPVPRHWSIFRIGEKVVINDYTFEVKYVGETAILLEPVSPVVVGKGDADDRP